MKILIYSEVNAANIEQNLGLPEYSYYFVLKEFRPLLAQIGEVVVVENLVLEADAIYTECERAGEQCILLSFSPPHKTPVDLRCPCVCVFAWEFDSLPAEPWNENPLDNWHYVLQRLIGCITHSNFMANTVRAELGADFPVISIPAPVWDRFAARNILPRAPRAPRESFSLHVVGTVVDTRTLDISRYDPKRPKGGPPSGFMPALRWRLAVTKRHTLQWYDDVVADLLPAWATNFTGWISRTCGGLVRKMIGEAPVPNALPRNEYDLGLSGVVYTSVFNPYDGRKNWVDMVCAFCWAFRETDDATLVLKLTHYDIDLAMEAILEWLFRLMPFRCRIVLIHGFLADDDYLKLVRATTYVVNTSHGEGQCLPLMEFMSSGRPAISPCHTALVDYIDDSVAFIVKSDVEPTYWPHDPRQASRTLRHRLDWQSLVQAYRNSYHVALTQPEHYIAMAENAVARLKEHCSYAALKLPLEQFIKQRLSRKNYEGTAA